MKVGRMMRLTNLQDFRVKQTIISRPGLEIKLPEDYRYRKLYLTHVLLPNKISFDPL